MRNRFHAICPYFAMFPESFVQKQLIWSQPGQIVLDPFCGRGTTVFEALLSNREALAGDTNPVAVCVSRAKADPPQLPAVVERLAELEREFHHWSAPKTRIVENEFFELCFARPTLRQVLFLRERLAWRSHRTDCMISALALGCLHGESHRTQWCFSNRMPRTISTKPDYSIRWWRERGCLPPVRDVFRILHAVSAYRYESQLPQRRGRVAATDARNISRRFAGAKRSVSVVITSPPYLDTTHYQEDQWLRLWFLGGPERPRRTAGTDDRHRGAESYWRFLSEAWQGVGPLLRDGAHIIVRIGGRHLERSILERELIRTLRDGTGASIKVRDRRSSRIVNSQVHAFRPKSSGTSMEHDFHFQIV